MNVALARELSREVLKEAVMPSPSDADIIGPLIVMGLVVAAGLWRLLSGG